MPGAPQTQHAMDAQIVPPTSRSPLSGRCIRFVPPEIWNDEPAQARWREKYVPTRWRDPNQHILFVREGAADINDRYGEMLDELAISRCQAYPTDVLPGLALKLIGQGEDVRAWIAAGGPKNDPNEQRRSEDLGFLGDLKSVNSSVKRLARHFDQNQAAFPLMAALRSTNVMIVTTEEGATSPSHLLAKLLRAYASTLFKTHTARRGPFLHRSVIGPFVFPMAIDGAATRRGARLFAPSTAVMFGAVLAARQATGEGGGQAGDLMPKTGKPLYAVAAALVRAVTDDNVDADGVRLRLKDWIKRNPEVGWVDWPNRGV